MPSLSQLLRIEALERRDVPAAIGSPWADVSALTLSFAPDTTSIGPAKAELFGLLTKSPKSELFDLLRSTGKSEVWQRELLRAFQTWAVQTNANVAVVEDGKQAFGTSGDFQGDNRFGDIRIGATSLSADSLATASPPDPRIGTWAGDVVFNANKKFVVGSNRSGYDLYSVALHEAGHVFGLGHSDETASALTEGYGGIKTGLTPADVRAIQSLYGTRAADPFEGLTGNESFSSATVLPPVAFRELTADLSAVGDVDTFAFTVPGGAAKPTVRLRTAGVSSVAARVEVFDAAGRLVGQSNVTDPLEPKDELLKLPQLKADARYYLRVSSPVTDVFAVGRYLLTLNLDSVKQTGSGKAIEDKGSNDTMARATPVAPWANGNPDRYRIDAVLEGKADIDYYRLTSPTAPAMDALRIEIRNLKGDRPPPTVRVFNVGGQEYVARVLETTTSKLTLEILGIERGATYFVAVASPAKGDSTGEYRVIADFDKPQTNGLTALDSGTVSSALPEASGTLVVESARLFNFSLAVASDSAGADVDLQVIGDTGKVLATWAVDRSTGLATGAIFLPAGRYRLAVALESKRGQTVAPIRYWLFGGVSSDPIGPLASETGILPGTSSSTTPAPTPSTTPIATDPPQKTSLSPFLFFGPISTVPVGYAYRS